MSPTSRIECGHIYSIGLWSATANLGRIIRIDEKLFSGKSSAEIEVMVKLMMVKHYRNADGYYKKNELKSYVFYDLSGNTTSYSLEDLGLADANEGSKNIAKH